MKWLKNLIRKWLGIDVNASRSLENQSKIFEVEQLTYLLHINKKDHKTKVINGELAEREIKFPQKGIPSKRLCMPCNMNLFITLERIDKYVDGQFVGFEYEQIESKNMYGGIMVINKSKGKER